VPVRSRRTAPRHPLKSPRFPLCIPARLGRGARAQPPHDATASAEELILLLFTMFFLFMCVHFEFEQEFVLFMLIFFFVMSIVNMLWMLFG
jgi:hypothetical protein